MFSEFVAATVLVLALTAGPLIAGILPVTINPDEDFFAFAAYAYAPNGGGQWWGPMRAEFVMAYGSPSSPYPWGSGHSAIEATEYGLSGANIDSFAESHGEGSAKTEVNCDIELGTSAQYPAGTPVTLRMTIGSTINASVWTQLAREEDLLVDYQGANEVACLDVPALAGERLQLSGEHLLTAQPSSEAFVVFEVIPEPATLALLGLGATAFVCRRRK